MKRLHIIGRKNQGKTTLVVELVQELTGRGLRVGTIKHTHHDHELDTPGKDSHAHRQAGAAVVGVLSRGMSAVFVPTPEGDAGGDRYAALAPALADCDLVLVEGDTEAAGPKIEVWRASHGERPLAGDVSGVLAIVTDDPNPTAIEALPRGDVPRLAEWVTGHL